MFGCLQQYEDKHKEVELRQEQDQTLVKPDPELELNEVDLNPGRSESNQTDFQIPRNRAPKPRNVPGYRKNPEKWTCYSLEDVSSADMSEATNTSAALAFLEERRKLKNCDTHTKCEVVGGHTFKKPIVSLNQQIFCDTDTEKQASCGSKRKADGKIVMPECVIGQAKKIKATRSASEAKVQVSNVTEVELSYIKKHDSEDKDELESDPDSVMCAALVSPNTETVETSSTEMNPDSSVEVKFKSTKKRTRSTRCHKEDAD